MYILFITSGGRCDIYIYIYIYIAQFNNNNNNNNNNNKFSNQWVQPNPT